MKTPTLKKVKEHFKNAKIVAGLINDFDISKCIDTLQYSDNQYWVNDDGSFRIVWHKDAGYTKIISYIEPTTKVRNSVLLQLADNNTYSEEILKKECPKLFDNKLEVGKWYKTPNFGSALYYVTAIDGKYFTAYGFNYSGIWIDEKPQFGLSYSDDKVLATPQEVGTALIQEAKKRGFVDGVEFITPINEFLSTCNSNFTFDYDRNSLFNNSMAVFCDGKWSKITTPTDIITIVEKYGKEELQKYLDNYKH